MKYLTLDKNKILEYQKNRNPYLFIDHASKVIPGESAEGYKNLPEDEWFFKVHWPEDPNTWIFTNRSINPNVFSINSYFTRK